MAEQGGGEVSFTGLAVRTLGNTTGRVVAVVYALLNYALLVACVAGLHSILACWLPLPPAIVCILSPGVVVSMLAFTSFEAVDSMNRALCGLMLAAIGILAGIGIYFGQNLSLASSSRSYVIWALSASLRALPVIVLTLGFHVITPLVCKVVGGNPRAARKAILCGGAVPLAMVLAWNAVILSIRNSTLNCDLALQEKERDHFSQFVTESFTTYCKRKRRDKVYGNNLEIQAMAEMYNRPIHIYSYSTEHINIFHGSYETDLPPIRLSYHRGNHYNSLVDPCNLAVGVGLGFGRTSQFHSELHFQHLLCCLQYHFLLSESDKNENY